MVYTFVSGRKVVAKINENLNIQASNWINKVPLWIIDGCADMDLILSWVTKSSIETVTDYILTPTVDIKRIEAIEYEGTRLNRRDGINLRTNDTISGITTYSLISGTVTVATNLFTSISHGLYDDTKVVLSTISNYITGITTSTTYYVINKTNDTFQLSLTEGGASITLATSGAATGTFELRRITSNYTDVSYTINNGNIIFAGLESGDVTIWYKTIEYETVDVSDKYKVVFPMIPDNNKLIDALQWYILIKMMHNGYKHPTFSLISNNPYTNVNTLYENAKRKAKNSISSLDSDGREEISQINKAFVISPTFRDYDEFNTIN